MKMCDRLITMAGGLALKDRLMFAIQLPVTMSKSW